VRLADVDAVDRGADAFERALGLLADALLVVQVPPWSRVKSQSRRNTDFFVGKKA
jgi:hypothetical protein